MKPLRLLISGSIIVVILTLAVALMQLSTGNTTETFAAPAAPTSQVDVHGPAGSGQFGTTVMALLNGNVVVTDPNYNPGGVPNAGAIYLYNGRTHALISMITGSAANDQVGSDDVIFLPATGNFVVESRFWNSGRGAVTFCNGYTGCNGVVSVSNSLVGSTANDRVGFVTALSNGNYVVGSPAWDNGGQANVGAATFCNGLTGCYGTISIANSLVGTTAGDEVGFRVASLHSGNYVVGSPYWSTGGKASVGAATWGNGAAGITGIISASNSLVGDTANDQVGYYIHPILYNSNYVVQSFSWHGGTGAATWGNGATGITGTINASNSLVGSTPGDSVGVNIIQLTNGNYVISTNTWHNGSLANAGAATWGNGNTGTHGLVSVTNSLVGDQVNANVATSGLTALYNGNYVVSSPLWPLGDQTNVGAVTWGDGANGTSGVVSTTNSLVGSTADDRVGYSGVVAVGTGSYVVQSPYWSSGGVANGGAATWVNGGGPFSGVVSASNSLVGSTPDDQVGLVTYLFDGNYVAVSPNWSHGGKANLGAVTRANGNAGLVGPVTLNNSLVGTTAGDQVGLFGVTSLDSHYVVDSSYWNNQMGALIWVDSATGLTGTVSASNSLVGSTPGDQVGHGFGGVQGLLHGNFVAVSEHWQNGAGEVGTVTLGDDLSGNIGPLSSINSVLAGAVGQGNSLTWAYDFYNDQLVVGRPAENIVTFFEAPGIRLYGNGQYISNGFGAPSSVDGTYFGAVAVGSSLTHTFTISNTSVGIANLTGAPLVKISGAAAADFSVVVSPTASIAAGSSTTFRIRFSPSVTATRAATVMVTSTDADASPYTFTLNGTGGTPHDIFLPLIMK